MNRRPAVPFLAAILAGAHLLSLHVLSQDGTMNVLAYRGEQPARAAHGMVVSAHHLASDAGLEMLRAGGNAVDAAVATAFALAVVHPISGNLGGGGFLLLRTHKGKTRFIDFREKAPLAATETMYQDAKGNVISDASLVGYRSIATPGSVAGLVYAERKYGKLGLKRVIAPAIRLAREGFQLSGEETDEMKDKTLTRFADSKRIFQRGGDFYKEGETFKQPELARTLERIAADPDDFYHGGMARELVDELNKGGALITLTGPCAIQGRRAKAGDRHVSRLQDHQRSAAFVGGRGAGDRAEHSRELRPEETRGPRAGVDATRYGGLSPRVHGPLGVSWRSGLQQHSGCPFDREEICQRRGAAASFH